ncbi:MAG: hypothetical protein K0S07_778 [Chlamydiales bacterium]|jgi:hypothetical protein|nr:hypothetical protein [Chlamydiales bacterium]
MSIPSLDADRQRSEPIAYNSEELTFDSLQKPKKQGGVFWLNICRFAAKEIECNKAKKIDAYVRSKNLGDNIDWKYLDGKPVLCVLSATRLPISKMVEIEKAIRDKGVKTFDGLLSLSAQSVCVPQRSLEP